MVQYGLSGFTEGNEHRLRLCPIESPGYFPLGVRVLYPRHPGEAGQGLRFVLSPGKMRGAGPEGPKSLSPVYQSLALKALTRPPSVPWALNGDSRVVQARSTLRYSFEVSSGLQPGTKSTTCESQDHRGCTKAVACESPKGRRPPKAQDLHPQSFRTPSLQWAEAPPTPVKDPSPTSEPGSKGSPTLHRLARKGGNSSWQQPKVSLRAGKPNNVH